MNVQTFSPTTPEGRTTPGDNVALATIENQGRAIRTKVDALVIVDTETQHMAVETAKIVATLIKTVEAEREKLTGPLNDELKAINAHFKRYSTALEDLQRELKKKLAAYADELERLRREEEERQRRILEELRKKELEEAKAKGTEAAPALVIPTKEAEKTVHSDTGSATAGKRWTFEVSDANAVPRDYLTVDEKKIRAAVRDGIREIPGVRIYQETSISIR